MECNGTTYVGQVEEDLGQIRYVFCDACRTIAVDAWDSHRKRRSWGITYLEPNTLRANPEIRRKRWLLERVRRAFA